MLQCEKSAGNTVMKFAAVIRHCVEMYFIVYHFETEISQTRIFRHYRIV